MDKYIFDEGNGLWYELIGDYYFPCLTVPTEEEQPVGIWGQRHKRYIKEWNGMWAALWTAAAIQCN